MEKVYLRKCSRCATFISRQRDDDYLVIWEDGRREWFCKVCFVKVVLDFVPSAEFFLPKHKFDVRFWTMNPSKTSEYINERHKKYRERLKQKIEKWRL
jgi:hypothetical protein